MKDTITFLNKIIKPNSILVLGISGGPDSMCLLDILLKLKDKYNLKIICAHVNHNIRIESNEEEEFIKKICQKNNCIFESIKLNITNLKNFENKARKERYTFFKNIVSKYQALYLLTAHHGDDLIETILMHITRGSNFTGYAGFKKISEYQNYKLIRPLIYITKDDILKYCQINNVEYRIDQSNFNELYTRNRYRKQMLPFLKKENKNVHKKFLKFSEELELIENYLEKNTQSALTKTYDFGKVNLHELNELDFLIKKRVIEYILKEEYQDNINILNVKHINLIMDICASNKPNICINLPLKKVLVKEYNYLFFKNANTNNSNEYILEDCVILSDKEKIIKISTTDIEKSNFILRLNSQEIAFPLKVRPRKNSDYIKVKNLNGTKKVKDIFIDEKVPKTKRDNYPIVVDSKNRILWLPGLKKSEFDKNKDEFYDIIYKYENSEEK